MTINIHDIYKKNLQIKPVIVLDWLISLGFLGHFYNPVLDDKSKKNFHAKLPVQIYPKMLKIIKL